MDEVTCSDEEIWSMVEEKYSEDVEGVSDVEILS